VKPLFCKNKKGHYVVMGPTLEGRYLTVVFEFKKDGSFSFQAGNIGFNKRGCIL
jgi:hypothetical protein